MKRGINHSLAELFDDLEDKSDKDVDFDKAIQRELFRQFREDGRNRSKYTYRLFWLLCVYIAIVLVIIFFAGFGDHLGFKLEGSVLITLLSTTTANVIGLFVIVARYLFKPMTPIRSKDSISN